MQFIHKATVWTATGFDIDANPSWSVPTVIDCRWQDVNRMYMTAAGEQAISKSIVYTDRALSVGDYLFKGESAASSPPNQVAHEIKAFRTIENVLGTSVEYRATL